MQNVCNYVVWRIVVVELSPLSNNVRVRFVRRAILKQHKPYSCIS
jgi:hypothetical protein